MSQFSGSVVSSRTSIEGSVRARLIATNLFVVGKACNLSHTTLPQYIEYFMHLIQLLTFAFNPYVDGNYYAQSFVYALGFFPWWDLNFSSTLPFGGYLAFFWIVAAFVLFYIGVWVVGSFNPHFVSANILTSALRLKYLTHMMAGFLLIPFLHTLLSPTACDRSWYDPTSLDVFATAAQSRGQRLVPTTSVMGGADVSGTLSSWSTIGNQDIMFFSSAAVANSILSTISATEDPNVIRSRRSDPTLFFVPMQKCGWGFHPPGGNPLMLGHKIVGIILAVFLAISAYIKISCQATTELQPLLRFERGNNIGDQALFIAKIGLVVAFQNLISAGSISVYTIIVTFVLLALALIHVIYIPFMNVSVHRFTAAAYTTIAWFSFTCFIASLQRNTTSNAPIFVAFGGFWAVFTVVGAIIFILSYYFSTIRLNQKTKFLLDHVLKPGFVHPKDNPFYVACYNRDPDSLPYPEGLPETDYLFSPFRNIEAEITEEGLSAENEIAQQIMSAGRYGWRQNVQNFETFFEDDEYSLFGGGEFGFAGSRSGQRPNVSTTEKNNQQKKRKAKNNQSARHMKSMGDTPHTGNTSNSRKPQTHRASKAAMLRASLRIQVVSPTISVALTPYDAEIAVRFLYEWNLKTGRRPTPHMLAFACRIFAKFLMKFPDSGVVHLNFVRFLTTFAPSKARMRLCLEVLESISGKAAFILLPEMYEIFLLSLSVSDTLGERDRTHLHLYHRVRTTHRKTLIGIAAFWRSLVEDSEALRGDLEIADNLGDEGIFLDDEGSLTFAGSAERRRLAQKELQLRKQHSKTLASAVADAAAQGKKKGWDSSNEAVNTSSSLSKRSSVLGTSMSDAEDDDDIYSLEPLSTIAAINSLISLCHFANSLSNQREKAFQLYMSTLNVAADDEMLYISFADFCETVLHNYECADICRAEAKTVNYQKRKRLLEGVTGFGYTSRDEKGGHTHSHGSSSDANTHGSSGDDNNGANYDTVSRAPSMTSHAPERMAESNQSRIVSSSRRSGNSTTLIGSQKDAWIGASLPIIRASLNDQKQSLAKQINAGSLRYTVAFVLMLMLTMVAVDIAVVVTQLRSQIDMSSRLHSLGELRRRTQTLPMRLQQAIDVISGENFVRNEEFEYRFEAYATEVNRFIAISSKVAIGDDRPEGDRALVELFERPIAFFKSVSGVPKGTKVTETVSLSEIPMTSQVPPSMATYTSANIIEAATFIASSADAAMKVLFQTPIPSKAAVLDEECIKFVLYSVPTVGSIAFDSIIQRILELGRRNVQTSQITITIAFAVTLIAILLCYCAFVWEFRKGSVQKAKILALFHLIPSDALRRLADDAKLKTEAFIAASAAATVSVRSHMSLHGSSAGAGSSISSTGDLRLNVSSPGSGPRVDNDFYGQPPSRRPLFDTPMAINPPIVGAPNQHRASETYNTGLVNFPTLMMDSSLGAFPAAGATHSNGSPMDVYGNTPQSQAALGGIVIGPASSGGHHHTDGFGNPILMGNGSDDSNSKTISAATNNAANLVLAANASGVGVTMMRLLQTRDSGLQASSSLGASTRGGFGGSSGRFPSGSGGSTMGPNPLFSPNSTATLAGKPLAAPVLSTNDPAGTGTPVGGGEYTVSLLVRLKDQQLAHSQTRSSGAGLSKRTGSFSGAQQHTDTPSSSGQGGVNTRLSPIGNPNVIQSTGKGAMGNDAFRPVPSGIAKTVNAPPSIIASRSPVASDGTRTPPPQQGSPQGPLGLGLPPRPSKGSAPVSPRLVTAGTAKVYGSPVTKTEAPVLTPATLMTSGKKSPAIQSPLTSALVPPTTEAPDVAAQSIPPSATGTPRTALKATIIDTNATPATVPRPASAGAGGGSRVKITSPLKPNPSDKGFNDDDDDEEDEEDDDESSDAAEPAPEHAPAKDIIDPTPSSKKADTSKASAKVTIPAAPEVKVVLPDAMPPLTPAVSKEEPAPRRRHIHHREKAEKDAKVFTAAEPEQPKRPKSSHPSKSVPKQRPLTASLFRTILEFFSLQHDSIATTRFLKELRPVHFLVLLLLLAVSIMGFTAATQHFASNPNRIAKPRTSENGIGCVYRLSLIGDRMLSTTSDFVSTARYTKYRDAIDAYDRWRSARWCAEWEIPTLQESDFDKETRGVKTVLPTSQTGMAWYSSQSSTTAYGTAYTSTPSSSSPTAASPSSTPAPSTSSSVLATEYFRLSDALERPTLIAILLGAKVSGFDDMLAPEIGGLRYTRENKTLPLSIRYDQYDEATAASHALLINSTLILPNNTNITNTSGFVYGYDADAEIINLLNSFSSSSKCRYTNITTAESSGNSSSGVNGTNSSTASSFEDVTVGALDWHAYSTDVKDLKKTRDAKWSIALRTSMDRFISADFAFYRATLKELYRQVSRLHLDTVDKLVTDETVHVALVAAGFGFVGLFFFLMAFVYIRDQLGRPVMLLFIVLAATSFTAFGFSIELHYAGRELKEINQNRFEKFELFSGVHRVEALVRNARMFILTDEHPPTNLKDFVILSQISDPSMSTAPSFLASADSQLNNLGKFVDELALVRPDLPLKVTTALSSNHNITAQGRNHAIAVAEVQRMATIAVVIAASAIIDDCSLITKEVYTESKTATKSVLNISANTPLYGLPPHSIRLLQRAFGLRRLDSYNVSTMSWASTPIFSSFYYNIRSEPTYSNDFVSYSSDFSRIVGQYTNSTYDLTRRSPAERLALASNIITSARFLAAVEAARATGANLAMNLLDNSLDALSIPKTRRGNAALAMFISSTVAFAVFVSFAMFLCYSFVNSFSSSDRERIVYREVYRKAINKIVVGLLLIGSVIVVVLAVCLVLTTETFVSQQHTCLAHRFDWTLAATTRSIQMMAVAEEANTTLSVARAQTTLNIAQTQAKLAEQHVFFHPSIPNSLKQAIRTELVFGPANEEGFPVRDVTSLTAESVLSLVSSQAQGLATTDQTSPLEVCFPSEREDELGNQVGLTLQTRKLRLRRALEMSKRAELQKCFAHVVKSRDHFKNQRKLFDAHREEYQQSRRKAASTRYMAYKWDLQASKGGVEEADKLSKIMGERDRFSRAASASAKDEPQRPPMSAMHQRAIAGLAPLPTFTRPPSSQFGSRPPTRPTRLAPLSQTKSQSQFTLNTPTRPSTALLLTNDGTPSEMPRAHSAGGSKLKGHYFTNMPVTSDGLIVRKGAVATVPLIKEQRSSARKKMLPNIVHPVEAKMVQLAQTFAVMIKSGQVGPSGSSEDGSPTNRIKLEVITAPAPPLFVMLPAYAAVECSMGPLLSADQATVTSKGSLYEQAAWFFIKSKESVAAAGLPEGQEASMMAEADRLLLAGERIMIKLRRMGSEAAATESENLRSIVLSSNRGFGASSPFAYEHTLHNLSILRGKAMAAMLRATRQLTQALRVLEEVAVLESNPPPLPKPQRHSISSPPLSGSVFTDELGYSSEELSPIRSDAHRHLRSPLVKHPPPSPYLPHSTSSPLRSPRECALTVDTKVSHQPDASKSIVRTNPHNNQPEEILHDYTRGVRGGTFGRARKPIGDGDKRTKAAAAAVESARLHTPPRSPTRSPTSDSLHPPKHLHSPTMVASVPTAVPNPVTLANLASVSVALGHASEGLAYGRRSCTAVTKQLEANIASVLRALKKRDVIRKRDRQQDHQTTAASEGTLIAVTVPFAEPLELAVSALMAVAAAQAGQVSTVSAGSMPSERVSAPTTYRLAADLAATVLAPDHPISQHCRRCVEQISK